MSSNLTSRAWKNPSLRRAMSVSQQDRLPNNPASTTELEQEVINNKTETGSAIGTALCSPCPPRHCY